MTVGELAQRAHVDAARISRTLQPLTRKGLVARIAGARDRRLAKLQATERGHALYREMFPRLAAINRRLVEVLAPEEAQQLEDFLRRLMAGWPACAIRWWAAAWR